MKDVFRCRRCGHCCMGRGGIVLGPGDRTRLARHLNLSEAEMLERCAVLRNGKYSLLSKNLAEEDVPEAARCPEKNAEYPACLFFVPGKGCAVHPARPDVCRAWPYFKGNLVDPVSLAMAKADCPGIEKDAAHEEFARQGMAYLLEHGLANPESPANALRIAAGEGGPHASD